MKVKPIVHIVEDDDRCRSSIAVLVKPAYSKKVFEYEHGVDFANKSTENFSDKKALHLIVSDKDMGEGAGIEKVFEAIDRLIRAGHPATNIRLLGQTGGDPNKFTSLFSRYAKAKHWSPVKTLFRSKTEVGRRFDQALDQLLAMK